MDELDEILLEVLSDMAYEIEQFGFIDSKNYLAEKKSKLQRLILKVRIDERQMLSFHRAYGRDYQETLETLEESNDDRIAQLTKELEK